MKKVLLLLLVWLLPVGLFAQQGDNNQRKTLVFTHVTVIDATGAPAKPDMTVVVRGDRIEALGKTGKLTVPRNAQVVDATGKFLIPGLWDMHIHPHNKKDHLALFIANGVTGMRVMWGWPKHQEWRKEISAGELIGPRMVISSPIIGFRPGDFPAGNDEDEGRQVVRKVKKEGADLVKVYQFIPRDTYFAIADEAKKQRIPFAGHVPYLVSAAEASDAGQQSIEHCTFVLLACSSEGEEELKKKAKETWDTRPMSLPHVRARQKLIADITYSEKKAAELFARFVKNSTWVCPTIIFYHSLSFRDEEDLANDPRFKYIPLSTKDRWKNDVHVALATGEGRADFRKICEKNLAIVGAMRDAGVGLLAGTDTYTPGFGLQDELALYVQAGLSPLEALQTATYNPAKCLGKLDSMGTVERGKIADLVLLDANPLQDISNTQKIAAVVVGGKIFQKAALRKMLAHVEATRLGQAAGEGNIEHVKLLISEGADVNFTPKDDYPPLHYAVWGQDTDMVELFVAHGAKFDVKDQDGWTAFRYAVWGGNRELVEFFVSKGADVSGIHGAALMGDLVRVKRFVQQGIDVDTKDEMGWTPLYWAASTGQTEVVEFLIDKGANVDTKAEDSSTRLHQAAKAGDRKLVELFISKGADVNAKTNNGNTPLHSAASGGNRAVVELLVAKGAVVNAKGRRDWTPLHNAASVGQRDVVGILLSKGADVNAKDVNGETPLHLSVRQGSRDIVELLITKGVDVNTKNKWHEAPLDIALDKGYTEIVELLRKHGAKE